MVAARGSGRSRQLIRRVHVVVAAIQGTQKLSPCAGRPPRRGRESLAAERSGRGGLGGEGDEGDKVAGVDGEVADLGLGEELGALEEEVERGGAGRGREVGGAEGGLEVVHGAGGGQAHGGSAAVQGPHGDRLRLLLLTLRHCRRRRGVMIGRSRRRVVLYLCRGSFRVDRDSARDFAGRVDSNGPAKAHLCTDRPPAGWAQSLFYIREGFCGGNHLLKYIYIVLKKIF